MLEYSLSTVSLYLADTALAWEYVALSLSETTLTSLKATCPYLDELIDRNLEGIVRYLIEV
jgi:hypothetical protein